LKGAEGFDSVKLGRYSVFRVHYEYADQEPGEKLFIVLKHARKVLTSYCMCIKATSHIERFRADKALWDACVFYKKGTLPFFRLDTIVDPSNFIPMLHSTLKAEADKGRYRIEGKMPEDFHKKIVEAIRKHPVIEPKKKSVLLECIGETL
jgi:hypothetical protein